MSKSTKDTHVIYRNSGTGRIVTQKAAERSPQTHEKERVSNGKQK